MIEIFRAKPGLVAVRREPGLTVVGHPELDGLNLGDLDGAQLFVHLYEPVPVAELSAEQVLAAFGGRTSSNGVRPRRPAKKAARRGRPPKSRSVKPVKEKRRGRAPAWDVALAEQLWKDPALTAEDIAKRVGAPSKKTITTYAQTRRDRFPKRPRGGARPNSGPRRPGQRQRFCTSCNTNVTGDPCPACGAPA